MSECDYLNARVRAMGAEILPVDFFEQILGMDAEELPFDALLASPYGPLLRQGLAQRAGISAIEWALRQDLVRCFSRVRTMAPPGPRALLDTQLARWDLQNVLAVLRGIQGRATPREVASALLPAGALSEAQLLELAASADPVLLARKLVTWNYPFAFELYREMARKPGADPGRGVSTGAAAKKMYRAYFRQALGAEGSDRENRRIVRSLLRQQIDLANITAALDMVRLRDPKEPAETLDPIPGGRLKDRFLLRVAGCATLEDAFSALDESYFAPGIEKGILAYGESRSLGVMERYLEELVIRAGCRLYREDPLSIAVALGYLWRKYNETVNLRALCRGKSAHVPVNAIRKELLLV